MDNGGGSSKTGINDYAKESNTPDFVKDAKGDDAGAKDSGNMGRNILQANEASASDDPNKNGRGGDKNASLNEKENNVQTEADKKKEQFKNSVEGVEAARSGNWVKAASKFKKSGPVMGIIGLLISAAFLMYGAQSLAPFSLVAVFQGEDPLNLTSVRADNLMRKMMNPMSRKQKFTINGKPYEAKTLTKLFRPDQFKISKAQEKRLKAKGFEVDEIDGVKILRYGDQIIEPHKGALKRGFIDTDANVIDYKTAMSGKSEMSIALQEGTMTWRSRVRYWFDSKIKALFAKFHLSRNKSSKADKGDVDDVKRLTSQDSDDPDLSKGKISSETEIGEDDNDVLRMKKKTGEVIELPAITDSSTPEEIEASLNKMADTKKGKFGAALSQVAQWGCMASNIIGSVMNLMRALNMMQVRQTALQFFEVFQKAQAGENKGDIFNTMAGMLLTPATNIYKTGFFNSADGTKMDTVEIEGTAMDASSVISKYEGRPRAPDEGTGALNPFANLGGLAPVMKAFGISTASFMTCASIQIATSVTSLFEEARTVMDVVSCFFPVTAAAGCSDLALNIGTQVAVAVTTQAIITSLVSFLVPKIANWLVLDITTQLFGQQLGHVIAEGIMDIENKNAQARSSSVATKETYIEYEKVAQKVEDENAQYVRATHSPFDPTSQYTFLGSLVRQVSVMANSLNTPLGALAAFGGTAVKSFSSLMPKASAVSIASDAEYLQEYTHKYCANLDSVHALAGDAFCEPLMIEDVSTLDMDPLEYSAVLTDLDCFEDDGSDNPAIKQKSPCMEYIVYYTQRESEIGAADQNIINDVQVLADNGPTSMAVSATPALGEVVDIYNNTNALRYLGYVTGEVGVTRNSGEALSVGVNNDEETKTVAENLGLVPDWDGKVKYMQRYIGDQSLLEGMGLIEESAVTAALRTYYENHPLDNSFEGILARKTGMTKENVTIALNYMKLANFAQNYKPADYAPYAAVEDEPEEIRFEEDVIEMVDNYKNSGAITYIVRRDYTIA